MNKIHFTNKIAFFVLAISLAQVASAETRRQKIAASPLVTDKQTGKPMEWNLSAGLLLGAPTGLVLKNEFSRDQAVDIGLSYSFNSMFHIYGDWHYRFPGFLRSLKGGEVVSGFEGYAGLGAALLFASAGERNPVRNERANAGLGVMFRIPLGVQYRLPGKPLVFFLELVPGIGVIPGTFGYFGGGVGGRYYF
jgi:hypothetical protein